MSTYELPKVEQLLKKGWTFEYSPSTRFIGAKHPKGGQFSVLEIGASYSFDDEEVGYAIANLLNNALSKEVGQTKHERSKSRLD